MIVGFLAIMLQQEQSLVTYLLHWHLNQLSSVYFLSLPHWDSSTFCNIGESSLWWNTTLTAGLEWKINFWMIIASFYCFLKKKNLCCSNRPGLWLCGSEKCMEQRPGGTTRKGEGWGSGRKRKRHIWWAFREFEILWRQWGTRSMVGEATTMLSQVFVGKKDFLVLL